MNDDAGESAIYASLCLWSEARNGNRPGCGNPDGQHLFTNMNQAFNWLRICKKRKKLSIGENRRKKEKKREKRKERKNMGKIKRVRRQQ